MNTQCIIVVPIYKPTLNEKEYASLLQLSLVIKKSYQICIICPNNLDITLHRKIFKNNNLIIEYFEQYFFDCIEHYSLLLMSSFFYLRFIKYTYMLIYQTDAWIFRNDIEHFIQKGYDWIGAPWFKSTLNTIGEVIDNIYQVDVGNGGFNLRHIQKCYDICNTYHDYYYLNKHKKIEIFPEDVWISVIHGQSLNIPDVNNAVLFSLEYVHPIYLQILGDRLPMGCHGWNNAGYLKYSKYNESYWHDKINYRKILQENSE